MVKLVRLDALDARVLPSDTNCENDEVRGSGLLGILS